MHFAPSGQFKKVMVNKGDYSLYIVEASDLLQQLLSRQKIMPPAMLHVGEACMAALFLQALFEKPGEELRVDIQWNVDGPFGKLYADSFGEGRVRSIVQKPETYVDQLRTPLGKGVLGVVRKGSNSPESITGYVESNGSVIDDIVGYLANSEQKACRMQMLVHVVWDDTQKGHPFRIVNALGYMAHFLPTSSTTRMEEPWERANAWDERMRQLIGNLHKWILPPDKKEQVQMLEDLLSENNPVTNVFDREIQFYCPCSLDRATRTLALLTKRELGHLTEKEDKDIEMKCEYCGEIYKIVKE